MSKEKEPSVYQKAINELLIGLEERDAKIKVLEKEIQKLKDHVETMSPLVSNLKDQIKMDYLIENWDRIGLHELEEIVND